MLPVYTVRGRCSDYDFVCTDAKQNEWSRRDRGSGALFGPTLKVPPPLPPHEDITLEAVDREINVLNRYTARYACQSDMFPHVDRLTIGIHVMTNPHSPVIDLDDGADIIDLFIEEHQ